MSTMEGILLVIIILLIFFVLRDRVRSYVQRAIGEKECEKSAEKSVVVADTATAGNAAAASAADGGTPEQNAAAENAEHFASCRDPAEDTARALDCMCDGNNAMEYAVNEFGAPGMEYKDWVATQAIDPTVVRNHAEFVADRQKLGGQNMTRGAYSFDSHDSYDPIPWVGLRRPQAVKVCNPTQVPDVDVNLYNRQAKFSWNSSEQQ